MENLQITNCANRGCRDAGEAVEQREDVVKELRAIATYKKTKKIVVIDNGRPQGGGKMGITPWKLGLRTKTSRKS